MRIYTSVKLLKTRRTKIMATLGPASNAPETIAGMIEAGVDVFRLNMSHGDYDSHAAAIRSIKEAVRNERRPVGILADLGGAKIRVGMFRGGAIDLVSGEGVTVTTRPVEGEPGLIPSLYAGLANDVSPGNRILLDDGNILLEVEAVEGPDIRCRIVQGGQLRDRKGMNLPEVALSVPPVSDKDRADAQFAIDQGVDFLALSCVRRSEDVRELRAHVEELGGDVAIVAKVEKVDALTDIVAIADEADAIMVARGDLGVELPSEVVPVAQDQLVDIGRMAQKPVIVATEMLDSMARNPRPTRAEVADVSQAVKSGADALMLSAETTLGQHPVRVVEVLDRIIRHTEAYLWEEGAFRSIVDDTEDDAERPLPIWKAMGLATAQLSRDLRVRTIVVVSRSGTTARMVAAARPAAPVVAVSSRKVVCQRMTLLWGVIPTEVDADEADKPLHVSRRLATELGLAQPGHTVLVVRGFHEVPSLNQPTVSVLTI